MRHQEHPVPGEEPAGPSAAVYSTLVVVGLVAPAVTFAIAVSGLASQAKIYALAATSVVYLSICFWSYGKLREETARSRSEGQEVVSPEDELTGKLRALEEANEFFGGSLQPADTFRLVSNRILGLFDFDTSVLFLVENSTARLKATQVQGKNQTLFAGCEIEKGVGLAGLAAVSGDVEFAHDLGQDRAVLPTGALAGFKSSVAIPVFFNGAVFGVLQLFSRSKIAIDKRTRETLEAVSERIGPMLRGSIAFEESVASSLTDPLTQLPNERAFFMILENQLAESVRSREERPLAIAAFDILGFEEPDKGYDPAEGVRLLNFVADAIRGQLRKMDFLARSGSGEFLVILPTAPEAAVDDVVNRIWSAFATTPFIPEKGEPAKVWLSVGRACFWKDGETANQLLQTARLRKEQAKMADSNKVLWFPKEYVN